MNIPVFLVDQRASNAMLSSLNRVEEHKDKTRVTIDYVNYLKNVSSEVKIQITAPPDDINTYSFLRDLYDSDFTKDIVDGKMKVELDYTLLHCDSCAKQGYTIQHENCVSGGRYCIQPVSQSGAEPADSNSIFGLILTNKCVEKILTETLPADKAQIKLFEYYWTLREGCIANLTSGCVFAIINKRLDLTEKVRKCMMDSFVQQKDPSGKSIDKELLDNSILADIKSNFSKVKDFADFPLIRINDIIYHGQLSYNEVGTFVCDHLKGSLKGCYELRYEQKIAAGEGKIFKLVAFIAGLLLVVALIGLCRQQLRRRYQTELNFKIDQTVDEYLNKSDRVL